MGFLSGPRVESKDKDRVDRFPVTYKGLRGGVSSGPVPHPVSPFDSGSLSIRDRTPGCRVRPGFGGQTQVRRGRDAAPEHRRGREARASDGTSLNGSPLRGPEGLQTRADVGALLSP